MSGFSTNGMTAAAFPLTGSETAAFDSNLTAGLAPETEAVSVNQLMGFARAPFALTDGATVAVDASKAELFTLTLSGNRTLTNPTNLTSGKTYRVLITQDAVGARTLTYGTAFKFAGGTSTLTTTAGAVDMLTFTYDGNFAYTKLDAKFS